MQLFEAGKNNIGISILKQSLCYKVWYSYFCFWTKIQSQKSKLLLAALKAKVLLCKVLETFWSLQKHWIPSAIQTQTLQKLSMPFVFTKKKQNTKTQNNTLPVQFPAEMLIWSHSFFMRHVWPFTNEAQIPHDQYSICLTGTLQDTSFSLGVKKMKQLHFLQTSHSFMPVRFNKICWKD